MASPGEFYASLPPVTKLLGTAMLATTCAFSFGLVDPGYLILHFPFVIRKFQIWRLLTNAVWLGKFSPKWGAFFLMLAQFGVSLEKNTYAGRTADFLYMVLFGLSVMTGLVYLVPGLQDLGFFSLAPSLIAMLVYIWSRENSTSPVNFMGLASFPGFYMPWINVFMDLIFGWNPYVHFMGIFVGHVYYFLNTVYPSMGGPHLMTTPLWVHRFVANWQQAEYRAAPRDSQTQRVSATLNDENQRRRAFAGRSYRLDRD